MAQKNVLMICYYYPPLNDVGTKRSVAFSIYFRKYGWEPYVVSVRNPDKSYCQLGNTLPPPNIHVDYTYSIYNLNKMLGTINGFITRLGKPLGLSPKRNYLLDMFAVPDVFSGWIVLTTIRATRVIRNKNIDVIYASCSPFSSALIGVLLKWLTGKPLVLDFRDIFSLDTKAPLFSVSKPKVRKQLDVCLEKGFLKQTDLLVVTTEEMRELYSNKYKNEAHKIVTVHNGFDANFMSKIDHHLPKYDKFTIIYSGNFYFDTYDPYSFFEALCLLKERDLIDKKCFQFIYYGGEFEHFQRISREVGIEDLVRAHSYIQHEKLLSLIRKSHLALIRIIRPMISTKVFEGIALNIPLLAVIPRGEVEMIIRRFSPSSYVISSKLNTGDKIAEAILDGIKKYKSDEIIDNRVDDFLKEFSRENLSLKLMELMNERVFST